MRVEIPQLNATARVGAWLFLRALAAVYFVAFSALVPQLPGLVGAHGILPAHDLFAALGPELGWKGFLFVPTLFWAGVSDGGLEAAAWAGTALSVLLFLDVAPALVAALLWFLYLSLVSIGQDFLSFQWDALLLETGLLAVLLAPWRLRPRFNALPLPPAFPLFLLRWLLFRFMLVNGLVKLASGDGTWRHLTALSYHYFTQPLPSPLSWAFAQLPLWFDKGSAVFVLGAELALPFLIWGNATLRRIAFGGIAALQALILLTGNLAFLNWLTLALACLLLDDGCFARFQRLETSLSRSFIPARTSLVRKVATFGLGGVLLFWSLVVSVQELAPAAFPGWLDDAEATLSPWRSVNGYGLFRVMTTTRPEIVIEGSEDGTHWRPYPFPYKPGNPKRLPEWIAPYQPRLDWQMWFAALTTAEKTPWFQNLLVRLLQGSPEVLRLFAANPFPNQPPAYVRALLYDYRFTTPAERKATKMWWKATPVGWYVAPITLGAAPAAP